MPPHVDPERSIPQVQLLSTNPEGTKSRRKVGVVLLEGPIAELEDMYDLFPFLQGAGPELVAATQTSRFFFPRKNLWVTMLSQDATRE